MAQLRALSAGRTTLFVAHRLSTVMHCDQIVVMDRGRVAETGSHEELLRAGGMYAAMWDAQHRRAPAAAEAGGDEGDASGR